MMRFCFLFTNLAKFVKLVESGVGESVELIGGTVHYHSCFGNSSAHSSKTESPRACMCTCRVTGQCS